MIFAWVRLNLIENIQETTSGNFSFCWVGFYPLQKLPGQSLGICLCKLKEQREREETSHLCLVFTCTLVSHRGESDCLPLGTVCYSPCSFIPSPLPGAHLMPYKCLLKKGAPRYSGKPSCIISPNTFWFNMIIMGAVSSPGEVICSGATHLFLDCPQKRIPDVCADALVKWSEVVSIFKSLETATCAGSWVMARVERTALSF